jgi:hypothetical protein
MQYLLIICHDDSFIPTEKLIQDILVWDKAMDERGIRKYGNPLRPSHEAKTIQVREGKIRISDGPIADTKEKMAAYELIDCAGFPEAMDAASRHPMAKVASIEIRPVWEDLGK